MDILKRIGGLIKVYQKRVYLGLFLQLIVIVTLLLAPYITKDIVNQVIPNRDMVRLVPLAAMLMGMVLLRAVANYSRGLIMERVSQNVVYDLRTGLYSHLQELPYEFYDHNRVGEIMSRMTGDIEGIRNLIAGGIITVFDNSLKFIGGLVFMTFMSWQLTLALIIIAPILSVTAWQFNKRIRPVFRSIREQNAVLNTRTQENLAGIRVVKAFAREDYEEKMFLRDNQELLRLNLKATWVWSNFVPLMEVMSSLCTPIMIGVGGTLLFRGEMDLGTLIAITGYIGLITNPMRQLSNIINMLAQAVTSAEKLFYYVDFGASIKDDEDAVEPEKFEGHVKYDHVTFSYGGRDVLSDISFEALPGQTIAVVGSTGSGKSTLVSLMGRFYDIKSGSVEVDGVDVRHHKLKPLRRHIGYVMQDTFLFSDTLADNIRFGEPDASMERVVAAARNAQAEEFIDHMPNGYEEIVGERGTGLSGGQKQRTAIARALLINSSILIFDDSTSAVDMETEYEIQQALKRLPGKRTTFIIAHRISSVKNADQILVLDDGRIAERGTHAELLKQHGIYYGMVRDQYRDFEKLTAGGNA